MAQFNVDSEVIAAKSAQARSYVASITADVNGMTASLHDLQSSWTGSASANFQGVLDQWHATQRQVEASITQINEALTRAGVNYADTEQANAPCSSAKGSGLQILRPTRRQAADRAAKRSRTHSTPPARFARRRRTSIEKPPPHPRK